MVYHYWSIVDPGLKTNAAYRTYSNSHLFCDLFVSVCMSSPQKLLLYMNAKRGPLNPTVGDSVVRKRELKSRTCALHGRAAPTVTSEPTRSQADYIADVSIRGEQTRRAGSTATVTCAKLCHSGVSPLHPHPPRPVTLSISEFVLQFCHLPKGGRQVTSSVLKRVYTVMIWTHSLYRNVLFKGFVATKGIQTGSSKTCTT